MISIQRRLQLTLLASAAALLVLLLWGGGWLARSLGEDFIRQRLQIDAESLLAALDLSDPASATLDARLANPVFRRPFSGHYYRLIVGQQLLNSPSLWDSDSAHAAMAQAKHSDYADGPDGQTLLLFHREYQKRGQPVTITLAEDITPLLANITLFRTAFATLALLLIGASALLQFAVVRSAFHRLDRVREDLQRLERGELESLPEDAPAELRPLVAEINRLLGLLGQRVERSRRALGDLAHALKGPLNLQLQTLRGAALVEQAEVRDRLLAQAERIEALMARELRRARLAGTPTPGRYFDPISDLPDLINTIAMMHAARALEFGQNIELHAPLAVDREDLLELLGNLLDNAAKWAESRVRCEATAEGNTITFAVEDDGAGCAEDQLSQLTTRGLRLDERTEGHGLGLSIAADIAALYGGMLHFDRSPELGGLRVRLELPAAGSPRPQ